MKNLTSKAYLPALLLSGCVSLTPGGSHVVVAVADQVGDCIPVYEQGPRWLTNGDITVPLPYLVLPTPTVILQNQAAAYNADTIVFTRWRAGLPAAAQMYSCHPERLYQVPVQRVRVVGY